MVRAWVLNCHFAVNRVQVTRISHTPVVAGARAHRALSRPIVLRPIQCCQRLRSLSRLVTSRPMWCCRRLPVSSWALVLRPIMSLPLPLRDSPWALVLRPTMSLPLLLRDSSWALASGPTRSPHELTTMVLVARTHRMSIEGTLRSLPLRAPRPHQSTTVSSQS